jgi:hypothetical protein
MYFLKCFKIDYLIFKYFLTSKMAVLTKICLMVIHFFTAYFKRRITSSASDSQTVLHTYCAQHDVYNQLRIVALVLVFGRKKYQFFMHQNSLIVSY